MDKVLIEKYKDVEIFFIKNTSKLSFNFEGVEREVKYLFEACEIIDEPKWKSCDLKGYYVDGFIDNFVGLAKATRINIKSNEPDWLYRGKYDLQYKRLNSPYKVFLSNEYNDNVYKRFLSQKSIVDTEQGKLNRIAEELK
jgi:hypothetical protein